MIFVKETLESYAKKMRSRLKMFCVKRNESKRSIDYGQKHPFITVFQEVFLKILQYSQGNA